MDGRRKPVLAASIAVFREGKVLLAQRGKAPALGLYSLPGGRIEPGETLQAAVLRELEEEVGIRAEVIGFIDHVEHIETTPEGEVKAHAIICAYAGHWLSGEPQLTEEAVDVIWVDPLHPPALPMTRRLPEILARAAKLAGVT